MMMQSQIIPGYLPVDIPSLDNTLVETDSEDNADETDPLYEKPVILNRTSRWRRIYTQVLILTSNLLKALDDLRDQTPELDVRPRPRWAPILPSFVADSIWKTNTKRPHSVVPSLDGLRGVACWIVFTAHFYSSFSFRQYLFWNPRLQQNLIIQFPVIRILTAATTMVAIFFIMSGYVLSLKALRQMRNPSQRHEVIKTISSSIFRRGIRLYVPTMVVLTTCFILGALRAYDRPGIIFRTRQYIAGIEPPPIIPHSLSSQFQLYQRAVISLTWPWDWYTDSSEFYDGHLWTIANEFVSSMFLFLVLCGVSQLRAKVRMFISATLVIYTLMADKRIPMLFIFGTLLAEIHLCLQSREIISAMSLPLPSTASFARSPLSIQSLTDNNRILRAIRSSPCFRRGLRHLIPFLVLLVGLFLGSCPNFVPRNDTFFKPLVDLVPQRYPKGHLIIQSFGAMMIVAVVVLTSTPPPKQDHPSPNCPSVASTYYWPFLQRLLTNRVSQYMGKISFALYLTHGTVIKIILYPQMPTIWNLTNGRESNIGFVVTLAIESAIMIPICIWIADLFWRGIDMPSIRLARVIERWVLLKEENDDADERREPSTREGDLESIEHDRRASE